LANVYILTAWSIILISNVQDYLHLEGYGTFLKTRPGGSERKKPGSEIREREYDLDFAFSMDLTQHILEKSFRKTPATV
jgi:hypothetical protein